MTADRTPGWVLDVLLAAARCAGVELGSVYVSLNQDATVRSLHPHPQHRDVATAVALFAALGVRPTIGDPYGPFEGLPGSGRQADVEADVPVLDVPVTVIVTGGLPADGPVVAELAHADIAHAAAGDPAAALGAAALDTTHDMTQDPTGEPQ